jgi:hypothetical protein
MLGQHTLEVFGLLLFRPTACMQVAENALHNGGFSAATAKRRLLSKIIAASCRISYGFDSVTINRALP